MKEKHILGLLLLIPIITSLVVFALVLEKRNTRVVRPKTITEKRVLVGVSKNFYLKGDLVIFWIKNERKNAIRFANKPPWHIEKKTKRGWQYVYGPVHLPVFWSLQSNATRWWGWKPDPQRNDSVCGEFRVVIPCEGHGWGMALKLSFSIISSYE